VSVPADLVSVVVPTRNSASHLRACLASIKGQTHSPLELIVVDNHSEDDTQEIARELADMVAVLGPERSAQRNEGARLSTGAYVFFVDSDMVLEPGVVAEAVALAAAGPRSVVIPEVSFGSGFWARCKALERSLYLGDETVEAARFFRRADFEAVGGFDEEMPAGPEDWDLHERIRATGVAVARTSALIYHDEGRPTLGSLARTKLYYGRGMATYIRKHPELARRQLTLVRPAFLRNWRALAADPVTAAGMVVMKTCEFAAGGVGLISERLSARDRG
jgi:glycosyltransferase involved in cell wall biosynthesis